MTSERGVTYSFMARNQAFDSLAGVVLTVLALGILPHSPERVEAGPGGAVRPPVVASYRIDVRLDPVAKTLTGRERISFVNRTRSPTDQLVLHLYPNAFRSGSIFLSEWPAAARASIGNNGGMEVGRLSLANGADLLASSTLTDTLLFAPLPAALLPGGAVEIDVEFEVRLPRVIARSGWWDDDHFTIGQWFPKLAVLEEGGWNASQYHAWSEFYSDFGRYEVAISLPERFVVGATGLEVGEERESGWKTLHFQAEDVHDFAWVANPRFQETIDRVGQTEVRLLWLPEDARLVPRFREAARIALERFGAWYLPYPYPRLTITDVPPHAGAGMEYPTLVTVSGNPPLLDAFRLVEEVTVHEIAHQWFYGLVATDEANEPWLDEGFTSYATARALDDAYGRGRGLADLGWGRIGGFDFDRAIGLLLAPGWPFTKRSWDYPNEYLYSASVYGRTSISLASMEAVLGPEAMNRLMRAYVEEWAFRHPKGRDFRRLVAATAPAALPLLDGVTAGGELNAALESLMSAFDPTSGQYETIVVLGQTGSFNTPVEVEVLFANGERIRKLAPGEFGRSMLRFQNAAPAVRAQVDPDRRLLLDRLTTDNGKLASPNVWPIVVRAGQALFWLQLLLGLAGG